jgi:transposase
MHKDVIALPNPNALPDDLGLCHQMIRELLESLTQERGKIAQIQHRLELLLQRVYGPRSERINPNQLLLFANQLHAVDPVTPPAPLIEPEPEPSIPGKNRSHGRKELPADLPRIALVHDLTEAEKACPDCGQIRQQIGEEKTEQLDYVPASVLVIEHWRPKYACRHCEGQVAAAAKPAKPIPKGIPAPGLSPSQVLRSTRHR